MVLITSTTGVSNREAIAALESFPSRSSPSYNPLLPSISDKSACLDLLEKIYAEFPSIPVIVITAVNEVQIALKAIKLGAYEFITKPPDTDRLLLTIKRALAQKLLETERDSLRKALTEQRPERRIFSDIITDSQIMFKVFEIAEIFAPTDEIVLIAGETGTGKDMIAKKIHDLSARRNKPFIAVNCPALSRDLILERVWGWSYDGNSRTVDVHVRWLREKIEPDPKNATRIVTVRGIGYRFDG